MPNGEFPGLEPKELDLEGLLEELLGTEFTYDDYLKLYTDLINKLYSAGVFSYEQAKGYIAQAQRFVEGARTRGEDVAGLPLYSIVSAPSSTRTAYVQSMKERTQQFEAMKVEEPWWLDPRVAQQQKEEWAEAFRAQQAGIPRPTLGWAETRPGEGLREKIARLEAEAYRLKGIETLTPGVGDGAEPVGYAAATPIHRMLIRLRQDLALQESRQMAEDYPEWFEAFRRSGAGLRHRPGVTPSGEEIIPWVTAGETPAGAPSAESLFSTWLKAQPGFEQWQIEEETGLYREFPDVYPAYLEYKEMGAEPFKVFKEWRETTPMIRAFLGAKEEKVAERARIEAERAQLETQRAEEQRRRTTSRFAPVARWITALRGI